MGRIILPIFIGSLFILPGCWQQDQTPSEQPVALEEETKAVLIEEPTEEALELMEAVATEQENDQAPMVDEPDEEDSALIQEQEQALEAAGSSEEPNLASNEPKNLEDLIADKDEAAAFLKQHVAQGKTIIDFYATWCPPCRMMLPILDQLAQEYPDISILKVNIDKFVDLSNNFNITGEKLIVDGVPTFHLFKNGKFVGTINGGMRKEAFVEQMNSFFNR